MLTPAGAGPAARGASAALDGDRAVESRVDDGAVGARPAVHEVACAVAGGDRIGPAAAEQAVAATPAEQLVRERAAEHAVGPSSSEEQVAARTPLDPVGARSTFDAVVAGAAD